MEEEIQMRKSPNETKAPETATKKKTGWFKMAVYIIILLIVVLAVVQVAVADRYRMQVQVIEGEKKVGVNPTTEMLDFGDLSADTSATRIVTLNAAGSDTYVHVSKFGDAAELVKVSENNFTMTKGDEKKLEFAMYMPPSAPVGKWYKGWVVIFKIPKVW